MPRFDGTGPCGMGPCTGYCMGPCGRGFGRGFGFRRSYSKKDEIEMLKEEEKGLEEELKAVKERVGELGSEK